jgi:hypothetical protein
MASLKSVSAYTAAALGIPIMVVALASFAGFDLGGPFLAATGLKTSANWTGGEVTQTIDHENYRTEVHRPVFDALIGKRREGFVQVAWRPADALPARIDEEIDAEADGQADFRVELDTGARKATVTPFSPDVMELQGVYDLGETLAIRVKLKNPRR